MWGPCSCGGDGIPRHRYRFHKHESKHWSCTKNVFGINLSFLRSSSRGRNVEILRKSIPVLDLYSSFTQNRNFFEWQFCLLFKKYQTFWKVFCVHISFLIYWIEPIVSVYITKLTLIIWTILDLLEFFDIRKKKSRLPYVKKLSKYSSTIVKIDLNMDCLV